MTLTHSSGGGRFAAALVLAVLAASLGAHANQGVPRLEPRVVATTTALALCARWREGSSPLVVVGPRVSWHGRGSESAAVPLAAQLIDSTREDLLIAARGQWVVAHDRSRGGAVRMDCGSDQRTTVALPRGGDAIDVSARGAIAVVTAEAIAISPAPQSGEDRVEDLIRVARLQTEPAGVPMWAGEQLLLVGNRNLFRIRLLTGQQYQTATVPLDGPASSTRLGFWFNGLAYVLRDNCFDLFVGADFASQIKAGACLSSVPPSYVIATQSRLIGVSAGGSQTWAAERPTVLIASFDGGVREATANLATLAVAPWTSAAPIALDGAAGPSRPATVGEWRAFVGSQYWSSAEAFDAGMRAVAARGWAADARYARDQLTLRGNGVWAHWDERWGRVAPAGRTLTQIARDEYGRQSYSDQQVRAIWTGSEALAETLEGRLFAHGWLPTAAQPSAITAGNQTCARSAVASASLPERLMLALTLGSPMAGGLGDLSSAVHDAGTSVNFSANKFEIVDCELGGMRTSQLVVYDARLRPASMGKDPGGTTAQIQWPKPLNVMSLKGEQPFWQVPGPLVIGTRTAGAGREPDPAALRALLDRVVAGYQEPLLVPVTRLQMAFVARADWRVRYAPIPRVSIDPAEIRPAQSRGAQPAPCDAAQQRTLHESIIDFPPRQEIARSTTRVMGLAENAVDRQHAIFRAGEADSDVWVVLGSGVFEHFNAQSPPAEDARMSPDPATRTHSRQVAGILLAQHDVRGLLDRGLLAWVNTADNFANVRPMLDRLAERHAVVNVSVQLDSTWGERDQEGLRSPTFHSGLLLVASAANPTDKVHGAPIEWRLPNVIGVGVVDGKKAIPANARYSRTDIDLVAPGVAVPAHADRGGMECIDGTSYATAHVTAVAAMLFEAAFKRDPALIRARLLSTADWDAAYAGKVKGGLLNARRAQEFMDKNVMKVITTPGQEQTLLAEVSELGAAELDVSTTVNNKVLRPRVRWRHLLRLQRLSDDTAADPVYRVAYVNENLQFVIHDEVKIDPAAVAPLTCRTITGGTATCEGMRVHRIRDYVAKMYRNGDIIGF